MIISAKSLSGDYISIEISDNSTSIEEEFEKKYRDLYVDSKLHPFLSVKLLETAVFYYDEKGNEDVKSEWSFLINIHNLAKCLERYEDYWSSLCLNPHPYIIEMFEKLEEEEKTPRIYKGLSRNPVSIEFFIKNPDKISWPDMIRYNERAYEIIHLYKHHSNIWKEKIIINSPKAYDLVRRNPSYDQFNWEGFLSNKHIKPEWVQYVIDTEPYVFGEYLDSNGTAHGEYDYVFKLRKNHWKNFSKMPIMIPLLRKYMDKICWKELCENPCIEAVDMIRENPDKVVISSLCNNHTEYAINFLEEIRPDLDINKKAWSYLCRNPYATHILERYKNSIKYVELAKNTNKKAIEILKNHLSIRTLSRHYRQRILKNLIDNNEAGWLVLCIFEEGEFENLDCGYTSEILTKPYIFLQ